MSQDEFEKAGGEQPKVSSLNGNEVFVCFWRDGKWCRLSFFFVGGGGTGPHLVIFGAAPGSLWVVVPTPSGAWETIELGTVLVSATC